TAHEPVASNEPSCARSCAANTWPHGDASQAETASPSYGHTTRAAHRSERCRRSPTRGSPGGARRSPAAPMRAHTHPGGRCSVPPPPRALVLMPNDPTIALNSCYLLPCRDPRDAHALAALMNSPLVAAWLALIAEPARGSYRRFL